MSLTHCKLCNDNGGCSKCLIMQFTFCFYNSYEQKKCNQLSLKKERISSFFPHWLCSIKINSCLLNQYFHLKWPFKNLFNNVKQYFLTTRITSSKGKQNIPKLFASPIYYLSLHNGQIRAEKFLQLLNSCSYMAWEVLRFFGKFCLSGVKGRNYSELLWPVGSCLLLTPPMGTIRPMTPDRISSCHPLLSRCWLHLHYFFSISSRS